MKEAGPDTANSKNRVKELFVRSGKAQTYAAKNRISRFDHEDPRIYLITQGTVTLHADDQDTKELTVGHLVPGDIFGLLEPQTGAGINHIQLSACAKSPCTVIELSRAQLLGIALQDPEVLLTICSELSKRFADAVQKIGQMVFFDVRGRVSSALLELCHLPEATVHPRGYVLNSTRMEIALMAGCTREMVGRSMQELSKRGLLTLMGGKTLIHLNTRQN